MVHDFSIIEKKMVPTLCTWCTLLVQSWGGGLIYKIKMNPSRGLKNPYFASFFDVFINISRFYTYITTAVQSLYLVSAVCFFWQNGKDSH